MLLLQPPLRWMGLSCSRSWGKCVRFVACRSVSAIRDVLDLHSCGLVLVIYLSVRFVSVYQGSRLCCRRRCKTPTASKSRWSHASSSPAPHELACSSQPRPLAVFLTRRFRAEVEEGQGRGGRTVPCRLRHRSKGWRQSLLLVLQGLQPQANTLPTTALPRHRCHQPSAPSPRRRQPRPVAA